jgi:hypothetical protein
MPCPVLRAGPDKIFCPEDSAGQNLLPWGQGRAKVFALRTGQGRAGQKFFALGAGQGKKKCPVTVSDSRLFQISTFIFNVFLPVHIFRSSSQSHSCPNQYSKIDQYISLQTFIDLSHYNYQNHSLSNIFSNHFPLIHHSNVSKCWHWVILSQTMSYQFSLDLSHYLDFSL